MTKAEMKIFVSKTTLNLSGPRILSFQHPFPLRYLSPSPVWRHSAGVHRIPVLQLPSYNAETYHERAGSFFLPLVGQLSRNPRLYLEGGKWLSPCAFLPCFNPLIKNPWYDPIIPSSMDVVKKRGWCDQHHKQW